MHLHPVLGQERRRQLGHRDVRNRLHDLNQKRHVRRQLALAGRPPLTERLQRPPLRLARKNTHRRARAHPEVPTRPAPRPAVRNVPRYPLPKVQ